MSPWMLLISFESSSRLLIFFFKENFTNNHQVLPPITSCIHESVWVDRIGFICLQTYKVWFRCEDETFIVWPHGKETFQIFLKHINKMAYNSLWKLKKIIVFPSWTYLLFKASTDRYLHAHSHHHPLHLLYIMT